MNTQNLKTVVITGATGGIGFHSAIGIAKDVDRVIITGRNRERGEAAVQRIIADSGNSNVELVLGDVSSNKSVDELARALLAKTSKIDVLVNNAGYLGGEYVKNADGVEMHFAVNVVAPFKLTHTLLPALEMAESARVLNITGGDKPAEIDPDNLQAEKGFRGLMTYAHSKSTLEALTMAMSKALEPKGVTVNVLFPGRASTTMSRSLKPSSLPGAFKIMYPLFKFMFKEDGGKSARKAAKSTIWGATSPDLNGVTGRFYDTNVKEQKLNPSAYDESVQQRILDEIELAAHK